MKHTAVSDDSFRRREINPLSVWGRAFSSKVSIVQIVMNDFL
jgi:hypothetical protein